MKIKNLISYLLSSAVIVGVLSVMAFADDVKPLITNDYLTTLYDSEEDKLNTMGLLVDPLTNETLPNHESGSYVPAVDENGNAITKKVNDKGEVEKIYNRVPNFENDEYEIWALEETGEVGIRVKSTGQILLTNPYNVGDSKATEDVKKRLLSQIVIQYKDNSGAVVNFSSYGDAALNSSTELNVVKKQISVKNTRTGIRVEYTLGKEQAKYVVPRLISQHSFEENLVEVWENKNTRDYEQFLAYYDLKDPKAEGIAESVRNSMEIQWPITKKMAVYVLDPGVSNRELELLSGFIENNTDYDAEQMEADYEEVEYIDTSAAPALFRFAIEYSLDEHGVKITMPATSIKYDTSNYQLMSVKLLPYFCAGTNSNSGYTLLPDGSGTITRFEDVEGKAFTLTGKMYGKDYAYHSISGYTQETMRIPAFGLVETKEYVPVELEVVVTEKAEEAPEDKQENEATTDENAATTDENAATTDENAATTEENAAVDGAAEGDNAEIVEADENTQADDNQAALEDNTEATEEVEEGPQYVTQGFVAYFEEGDPMLEFTSDHGGGVHNYSSVYTTFYPRPSDTYALTSISSTGDAMWSVGSDRRYTGDYSMRILPIYGEGSDYTDMAAAVRNYLVDTEILTKLEPEEDDSDDVTLYLENFGTIKTQEKVVGFPVKLQSPLTTFKQTEDMITELQADGIKNINIKLTGWYNGGLEHTAPASLSIPSEIGGEKGLKKLVSFAKSKGVEIYPDLDFTYVGKFEMFDGVSTKDDTAKTMDGRSAVHRVYNALFQGFESDEKSIISPVAMAEYYGNISNKFKSFGTDAISLATLGSDLNSDFNEDYALNRDETMKMIQDFIEVASRKNSNIMVDGGNAYTFKYADHILNVPLDSSMNINTSESVPFMGMVLHGYTEFAGPAINLDGDYKYSLLKAIENGANLYYLVSKDNVAKLKSFPEFSKYYAIRYDNWRGDIVETYTAFNADMKLVKYATISGHEYIGTRIVKVSYDNGVEFILNYNTHEVTLEDGITTVGAMGYIRLG